MQNISPVLKNVLLLACLVFVITLTFFTIRLGNQLTATLANVRATSEEVRQAAIPVKEFATFQSEQLKSPANQKLIKQNLEVGAAAIGSIRLFNTQTIPRVNKTIDSLNQSAVSLNAFVVRTDQSVNAELLPTTTKTITRLGEDFSRTAITLNTSIEKVAIASETLTRAGVLTLDDLHKILSDEKFQTILRETATSATALRASSENVQAATNSIKASLLFAPDIAKDIQAFTHQQSKYGKLVILARIMRALTF